ncbi:hypothetical protein [Palleronia pelagia]|uniref:UrcA family protein n=1 Tax=Palleronia pelagia TaxID=387096 RepID=A0A1H8FMZ5_9RHOB|nr:hypothetical protein [Palleronia pelagia]SEN33069.1 hypothetical protein SAMN04488011_103400 [Palleronia pelagia]
MKRILTVIAASATLAGATAPAAMAQDAEVTMLTGKVFRALRTCDIDGNMVDELTMAQVAGITIASDSDDESEKCQRIRAIAMDE